MDTVRSADAGTFSSTSRLPVSSVALRSSIQQPSPVESRNVSSARSRTRARTGGIAQRGCGGLAQQRDRRKIEFADQRHGQPLVVAARTQRQRTHLATLSQQTVDRGHEHRRAGDVVIGRFESGGRRTRCPRSSASSPASPPAPAEARHFARASLADLVGDAGNGTLGEDVELIVSELVTNSVRANSPHRPGRTHRHRRQAAGQRRGPGGRMARAAHLRDPRHRRPRAAARQRHQLVVGRADARVRQDGLGRARRPPTEPGPGRSQLIPPPDLVDSWGTRARSVG